MILPNTFYHSFPPNIERLLQETDSSSWVESLKQHDGIYLVQLYKKSVAAGLYAIAANAYSALALMQLPFADRARLLIFRARSPDQLLFEEIYPTIERIARRIFLLHHNDGAVFRNNRGKLPLQPYGYYREYVHATDDITNPGVGRVVIGDSGEIFYSRNHYRSFEPLSRARLTRLPPSITELISN